MGSELMPDLPDGWTVKTLVDCTADGIISYGIVQPGQHDENGIPIIRINNFGNGKLDLSSVLKVSAEIENKFSRTRLIGGEVLLTLVGSTGQSLVAPPELAGWNVPRAVAVIRANDEVGAKWINLCLQTEFTKHFLDSRANTTVQKTLNLSDVRQIPIPIPPKNLKAFIETNILSLEEKITLNRQLNQTLEQMAQALFKSWFVDFDPVIDNALAAGNVIPEDLQDRAERRQLQLAKADHKPLPEDIRKLFPSEFELTESLGWVPKGWVISRLGDKVSVKRGGSPRPIQDFLSSEGLPWTKISDATASSTRFIKSTSQHIKPEGLSKTTLLKKGTLILSNSATPGLPKFLDLDACIHDGWLHFPEKEIISDLYLYQLFLVIREELIQQGNGSIFTNLKTDILKDHSMVIPSKGILDQFDKLMVGFHSKIYELSESTAALESLRDTLLPKLISGELRIPEVQAQLEEALV